MSLSLNKWACDWTKQCRCWMSHLLSLNENHFCSYKVSFNSTSHILSYKATASCSRTSKFNGYHMYSNRCQRHKIIGVSGESITIGRHLGGGGRTGTRRGKYRRSTATERGRVLAVAAAGNGSGDWRAAAVTNGVRQSAAYGWLRGEGQPPKKRVRVLGNERWPMIMWTRCLGHVEANPLVPLKELSDKLYAD